MFMHLWEIQHRNTVIKVTMLFMLPDNFLPWKDQVYSIVGLNLFETDSISKIMFFNHSNSSATYFLNWSIQFISRYEVVTAHCNIPLLINMQKYMNLGFTLLITFIKIWIIINVVIYDSTV